MAKPPGRCIFCRGPRLSKEHVFGDWLKELFLRDQKSTHTYGVFQWPKGVITREPKIAKHKRASHAGTRKVRVVCRTCNNEWLGALEDYTKPVLTPLIIGEPSNLSPAMQAILATWAAKTAMTAEWVRGISQEERTWLRCHQNPICDGPGKEHDEYIRDPYDSGYDPRRYGFRIAHVRRCSRNQPFSVLPFPGHALLHGNQKGLIAGF